jgi:hypothetical protein
MTQAETPTELQPAPAEPNRVDVGSDVVRRFAERGEDALQRLAGLPGGSRVLRSVSDLGRRIDEIGRRVRGVEELEARIARLEEEVAAVRGAPAETGQAPPRSDGNP